MLVPNLACLHHIRLGGSDLPRPWSKYTEGSSRFAKAHEQEAPPPTVREQKKLQKAKRAAAGAAEEEGAAPY